MSEWKFVNQDSSIYSYTRLDKDHRWVVDEEFESEEALRELVERCQSGHELVEEGWLPAARIFLGLDEDPKVPKYPETHKMVQVSPYSQMIGEFVDWLRSEKTIFLAKWYSIGIGKGDELRTVNTPIQDLLAEFFGIDRGKLEEEARDMLKN